MASTLPRRVGMRPWRSPIPAALHSPFPPAMVAVLLYLALLLLLAGGPPSSSQGLGVGVAAAALPSDDGGGGGAGPFVPPDAAAAAAVDAAGGLNKPTNGTSAGGVLGCWCGSASEGDDSIDHQLTRSRCPRPHSEPSAGAANDGDAAVAVEAEEGEDGDDEEDDDEEEALETAAEEEEDDEDEEDDEEESDGVSDVSLIGSHAYELSNLIRLSSNPPPQTARR